MSTEKTNAQPSTNAQPLTTEEQQQKLDAARGRGFFGKPLIEQLKLVAVFVLVGVALYYSRPTPIGFVVGAIFAIVGTLIRVWAGGHLTRDQKLTTSGPYQYTRNPFYLGRLLLIVGFAIMAGIGGNLREPRNIILCAVIIVSLFVFFGFYMPRKENREGGRLKKLFGPDYQQWKSNVPSLFPRLTPYVMNPKPWDKDLYMGNSADFMGNKEVWTTVANFAVIILFYIRMVTPQ